MECKLKNITVYYESIGEGKPIILLHSWSLDHSIMSATMEPIFKKHTGWRRIYPDLPGHGGTARKDWISNQDRMLEVVLDFIDHLIPDEHFAVAGACYGAYLARGILFRRAAFIDGMLLTIPLVLAEDSKRTLPAKTVLVKDEGLTEILEAGEEWFADTAVVQSRKILEIMRAEKLSGDFDGDPEFQAKIRENPAHNHLARRTNHTARSSKTNPTPSKRINRCRLGSTVSKSSAVPTASSTGASHPAPAPCAASLT